MEDFDQDHIAYVLTQLIAYAEQAPKSPGRDNHIAMAKDIIASINEG